MSTIARQLLAIAALPFVVTVVVPLYCRHVPRLVPRLRPWRPPDAGER